MNTHVAGIHASPEFVLTNLLVTVWTNASWDAAWKAGTLTTGVPSVDGLLLQYNSVSVQLLSSVPSLDIFIIAFAQPLNERALIAPLTAANASVASAAVNGTTGGADQLTFTQPSTGRVYTFTHGSGDCANGCTSHHNWQVTLAPDGSLTLQESGDPLPR